MTGKSNNMPMACPIARAQGYFEIASHFASDGLLVQQLDGIILWANPAYCSLMGYNLDELVGRNTLSFCMPTDETPTDTEIAASQYDPHTKTNDDLTVYRNRHRDGRTFWNQIGRSFHQFPDGMWVEILVCRDISSQICTEQQLRQTKNDLVRLASHDQLTGLANRAEFTRFLTHHLADAPMQQVGLLQIDLDKFKSLNDSFGHSAGDALLVHVATQIRKTIRSGDLAARIGGDEFVVVCPNTETLSELQIIGAAVAQAIGQPFRCLEGVIKGRACVGAALAISDTITPEEIMRRADFALFEAKRAGRGTVVAYNSDLHARYSRESELSDGLIKTLTGEGLTYYFQPTMSLSTGAIKGFETLVRWQHPHHGLLPPDAFLPLAQKLGLMADIDFGAMKAAMDLKQALKASQWGDIRVGFNGSEELLRHASFFERLYDAMAIRQIKPQDIVIEVLETVVIGSTPQANSLIDTIKRLHDEGFTTLLDDFGTGHAGLAHLAQLAVSGVKIDRSMTSNICDGGPNTKIIAMIHDLCCDLGLYVVTEGIETNLEAETLIGLGGQTVQGYWLAKPMPRDTVIPWLRSRPNLLGQIDRSAIAPMPRHRYLGTNS